MNFEEEMQDRKGVNEPELGWLLCSMCGKSFLPANNGDGKSPCCTADAKDFEEYVSSLYPEEI